MKYVHKAGEFTWIDLFQPTREETVALMEEYHLDPIIAEDIVTTTPKQQFLTFPQQLYFVFHFPVFRQSHISGFSQEIDIVLMEKTIITAHYDTVDALDAFRKKAEASLIHKNVRNAHTAESYFFMILHDLYNASGYELDAINSRIATAEAKVFSGLEKTMVRELSEISRLLINFKTSILPHREILESLKHHNIKHSNIRNQHLYEMIETDFFRIKNTLTGLFDTIDALRETNNSLLSTKQNEIMKFFTVVAFLILPFSLVANLFSMNTISTPIIGTANDFWMLIGGTSFVTLCLLFISLRNKWI